MHLSDGLNEFRKIESNIRGNAYKRTCEIENDRYKKLSALKQERRIFILHNMPFKFGDRLYYHCSKGSGYCGVFKGVRNWKVVMEITTKAGRRKFKDFEIDLQNILWLKKI